MICCRKTVIQATNFDNDRICSSVLLENSKA